LDQGLQYNPTSRFATVDELVQRLSGLPRELAMPISNISAVLRDDSRELRNISRKTLIGSAHDRLEPLFNRLMQLLMVDGQQIDEFIFEVFPTNSTTLGGITFNYSLPEGNEVVHEGIVLQLTLRRFGTARYLLLLAAVNGRDLSTFGGASDYTTPLLGQSSRLYEMFDIHSIKRPPPVLNFGTLKHWYSNDIEFEPTEDSLFYALVREVAAASRQLLDEVRDR
jgi:hypothetical protein